MNPHSNSSRNRSRTSATSTITAVANRIGRIAFATILAGVFVSLVELLAGDFTVLPTSSLLDTYIELMVSTGLMIGLTAVVIPPSILILWGLKRWFGTVRAWQIAGTIGVLIVLLFMYDARATTVGTLSTGIGATAYIASGLFALAIVEIIFSSDYAKEIPSGQLATGFGTVVIASVVILLAGVATMGLAGAAVDAAGLTDDDPEPAHDGISDEEFEAQFGHLEDVERADELVCADTLEREHSLDEPVAAEYEGNLSEWGVDVDMSHPFDDEERPMDLDIRFEHDEELHIERVWVDRGTDSKIGSSGYTTSDEGTDTLVTLTDSEVIVDQDDPIANTAVGFEVRTDEGEIHRYTADLCDDELTE